MLDLNHRIKLSLADFDVAQSLFAITLKTIKIRN